MTRVKHQKNFSEYSLRSKRVRPYPLGASWNQEAIPPEGASWNQEAIPPEATQARKVHLWGQEGAFWNQEAMHDSTLEIQIRFQLDSQ